MSFRLQQAGEDRVLTLPEEFWQANGFGSVVEVATVEGGILLRPARPPFEEAKSRLFAEKADLLRRLADAD